MFLDRFAITFQLSDLRERVQRLERENESLRARVESEAMLHNIAASQTIGSVVGSAIDPSGMLAKRGRAGGLARARQAADLGERWPSGRFMEHKEWEEIEREISDTEYRRYAAGGFARAARAADGTFLSRVREPEI